ncbi:MAG: hypothetical protein KDA85_13855, partial [Planctomycetaceae bacterium]|nr:hypothetical protein [Planctomycetaceae bacterium]
MRSLLKRLATPRRTSGPGSSTHTSAPHGIDDEVLVSLIRDETARWETASRAGLVAATGEVRRLLASGAQPEDPVPLVTGLSLSAEAIRRATGYLPYDVQLLAAFALCRNQIAQMQTGEGKTLSAIAAAVYLAMAGHGVHVMTPNTYLAERDAELAAGIAQHLQLSAMFLPEQVEPSQKYAAYDCDITYATNNELGF